MRAYCCKYKEFLNCYASILIKIFSKLICIIAKSNVQINQKPMSQTLQARAEMPQGANKVLDRRNIEKLIFESAWPAHE